jgi:hypothetical protein
MEKLFAKCKLEDVEQHRRFLSLFKPKIKKLCDAGSCPHGSFAQCYIRIERMLAKLGETPYEMLKEEHEKK